MGTINSLYAPLKKNQRARNVLIFFYLRLYFKKNIRKFAIVGEYPHLAIGKIRQTPPTLQQFTLNNIYL